MRQDIDLQGFLCSVEFVNIEKYTGKCSKQIGKRFENSKLQQSISVINEFHHNQFVFVHCHMTIYQSNVYMDILLLVFWLHLFLWPRYKFMQCLLNYSIFGRNRWLLLNVSLPVKRRQNVLKLGSSKTNEKSVKNGFFVWFHSASKCRMAKMLDPDLIHSLGWPIGKVGRVVSMVTLPKPSHVLGLVQHFGSRMCVNFLDYSK